MAAVDTTRRLMLAGAAAAAYLPSAAAAATQTRGTSKVQPIYRGDPTPSAELEAVMAHLGVLVRGITPTYFDPAGLAQSPPKFVLQEPLDTPLARLMAKGLAVRPTMPDGITQCRPIQIGQLYGEWIVAEGADPDRRMLYLHGGGYAMGDVDSYRCFVARLSKASGCAALAIDYRLAPEHPFPAALDDAHAAYQHLATHGPNALGGAERLFLVGDSAGGGLAIAAALKARDTGGPKPSALVAMSPGTDLSQSGATLSAPEVIGGGKQFSLYYGAAGPRHPLVSPLHAELRGMPPILLQAGETEGYLDDSVRLADKAAASGVEVTFEIWRGMPHVHQVMAPLLPEANEAIDSIGRFLRAH